MTRLLISALLLASCVALKPVERPRVTLFVPVVSVAPDTEAPQSQSPLFEAPESPLAP